MHSTDHKVPSRGADLPHHGDAVMVGARFGTMYHLFVQGKCDFEQVFMHVHKHLEVSTFSGNALKHANGCDDVMLYGHRYAGKGVVAGAWGAGAMIARQCSLFSDSNDRIRTLRSVLSDH